MMLLDRDQSWLTFNYRVLQEAADPNVPLFERLKFLAIFSGNQNEFFRVRYPQILALSKLKKKTIKHLENFNEDILEKVKGQVLKQLEDFGKILYRVINELKEHGIYLYYNESFREKHRNEVRELFLSEVLSYIQPIYLDRNKRHNFLPENNQLYFIITLAPEKSDMFTQAIVNIPSNKTQRFFTLSPDEKFHYVAFIDDIVRENLVYVFPNKKIKSIYSIKLNRDAELDLQDEYSGDLLKKIEKQLKARDYGPPTRLLYESGLPENLEMFLSSLFNVSTDEVFAGGRYHNMNDLFSFPDFGKTFYYPKRKPLIVTNIMNSGDIFKTLIKDDILLHVPYQSYNAVLSFFNQAAVDSEVSDIYITLYRVAVESHIINALISAAKNGKNVVAFVEIKARFDEQNNIKWSKVMKQAGVRIIYSIPGIKVHSKIALIVKRSVKQNKTFAVVSTGNFNENTAQTYADQVLMTTNADICKDLLQLFKFLEIKDEKENNKKIKFKNLLVSGFNMVDTLQDYINKEIGKAKRGEPALIRIKVNNLEDHDIIRSLYNASQAGVTIQLLVRSIYCLAPQIPELSENIKIKRIVGRYLEHSRIFIFGAGDHPVVIIGSADLMTRNLHHRIEVAVRIVLEKCKEQLIKYFELQWDDNDKSVWLQGDYSQQSANENAMHPQNAQESIYEYLKRVK